MAAQRAVRKLLLAVVAVYLLFLISVWHVVNRSSARSIAYAVASWFVSAPQPAVERVLGVEDLVAQLLERRREARRAGAAVAGADHADVGDGCERDNREHPISAIVGP